MKLAFSGLAHYSDLDKGYELYIKRSRKDACLDLKAYKRAVKHYCKQLAEKLVEEGMVDLPCGLGTIAAAVLTRKPIYIKDKFIGYGKFDWNKKEYDGNLKTFGLVYLPRHRNNDSLRCFGFVANRRLFKTIKAKYTAEENSWIPIDFTDSMI